MNRVDCTYVQMSISPLEIKIIIIRNSSIILISCASTTKRKNYDQLIKTYNKYILEDDKCLLI